MCKTIVWISGLVIAVALIAVIFLYSGSYNIAADEPHASITERMLETLRDRSIAVRADEIAVPDLNNTTLVETGAAHYSTMCTGCHLAPGMSSTELRQGLYPVPPNFAEQARTETFDPAQVFWIIKHGVKLTGMPAWGTTHDDESIWGLVAFVQQLPELSAEEYESLTAGSAESHAHDHGDHGHGSSASDSAAVEKDGDSTERSVRAESDHSSGHTHAAPDSATGVLDAFHHALEEGRGKQALQYLAEDVIILEGAHAQTRDEYGGGHLASDMAFLAEMDTALLSREVRKSASGGQVTIVTRSRLQGIFREKELDLVSSETAVLEKLEGMWKIVHLHWSSSG